ncbi:hypothetical protein [Arthrobacter sp. AZCC_0090]|uniref:hypothetical protein n=1 Tax=Arthrobacter sp. AZCC_0090 TaxID=2735881 RepID=UPI00161D7427|nr:hypothetical protein [Arthrobacter sp. AZCC_0090]MBB6405080.1 hypothetical protein [Arthrobacter sp. AZCC_0090]
MDSLRASITLLKSPDGGRHAPVFADAGNGVQFAVSLSGNNEVYGTTSMTAGYGSHRPSCATSKRG